MKQAAGLFVAVLLATAASAQTRTFGSVVFPGGTSATNPNISRNFGSVVFPGGSSSTPVVRGGAIPVVAPSAFSARPSFNNGNSFSHGGNSFRQPGRRGGRIAPATVYAYPVYLGGYGYYDGVAGPEGVAPQAIAQQPNVTVVMPPQQDVRPIIIQVDRDGQYVTSTQRQSAQMIPEPADEVAQAETEKPNYLIAFKDHTVYSSVAYWFDGDTLHYFTNGNTHNQASVSLIDRELTERLNREMGTDFKMPAVK